MNTRKTFATREVNSLIKALLGVAVLAFVSAPALAVDPNAGASGSNVRAGSTEKSRDLGPQANTAVGNARVIVADGTSLYQAHGGSTRWFAVGIEPSKTYTVEVLDPYGDLGANGIGTVGLFNSDGTTAPSNAQTDCSLSTVAPSLEVSTDGVRCVVRAFTGGGGKRGLFISIAPGFGTAYQVRVRESTIYGRWTTNGYDFHTELQNTSGDSMCAQLLFFDSAGTSQGFTNLTIPAFGANKYVYPNGTLVAGDNRGTLRIHACPGPTNFVAGQLHVSTYAYNPVTDKYLYFFTTTANGGQASNTW